MHFGLTQSGIETGSDSSLRFWGVDEVELVFLDDYLQVITRSRGGSVEGNHSVVFGGQELSH